MLLDVFNIRQLWLNYRDCNAVNIYRSSSIWSQRWHPYILKTLVIHQDEAKQLVWWVAKFLPCVSSYKRLDGIKTPWQAASGLLLLYTPRHWLLHAFLHEGTTFLFLAACQSSNCRSSLCFKSFQFKLQRPSNRHWLEVSFWYGAAFSSEVAVPVALAYCTCCGETPPCCYQVRHTSYALSFISVCYSLMWVSLQVAVGVKFEQCM